MIIILFLNKSLFIRLLITNSCTLNLLQIFISYFSYLFHIFWLSYYWLLCCLCLVYTLFLDIHLRWKILFNYLIIFLFPFPLFSLFLIFYLLFFLNFLLFLFINLINFWFVFWSLVDKLTPSYHIYTILLPFN